tara:strand:- start:100 stop:306 length:207 start_codon:yes stop_codon:yes gene_type:complete
VEVEIVINQTLQVFQVQQKEMLAELETLLLAIVEQVVAAVVLALLVRQEYWQMLVGQDLLQALFFLLL